jgi:hypothetical protein
MSALETGAKCQPAIQMSLPCGARALHEASEPRTGRTSDRLRNGQPLLAVVVVADHSS